MTLWNTLQKVLPHHALSRLTGKLANSRRPWLAKPLMRSFVRAWRPDMSDAARPDIDSYRSFNDLFTRALRDDARPQDGDRQSITSPVDGTLSQFGPIKAGQLLQAKGKTYSVSSLLGSDDDLASVFHGGDFITIYLAPYNYHRIHMPADGRLTRMTLVPGRLFSVNAGTATGIENLFARNERVACHFNARQGDFCMLLVGALNVGSIATTWHGNVTPPRSKALHHWRYADGETMHRGDEMGRFNLGSTVILLLPPRRTRLSADLVVGQTLRVGERIGCWCSG